eukprot:8714928-Karenia_brevis.AAC.1
MRKEDRYKEFLYWNRLQEEQKDERALSLLLKAKEEMEKAVPTTPPSKMCGQKSKSSPTPSKSLEMAPWRQLKRRREEM